MKELDILLTHFLQANRDALAAEQPDTGSLADLEILLAKEDDVLWDWLQHPSACPDDSLRPMLRRIRNG